MFIRTTIALVLVILTGYGLYEVAPLLKGPSITLESPLPGESTPDGFLTVSGSAHRTTSLALNGSPLLVDETGHFSRLITLPRGGAILTLTAGDRFGRTIKTQVPVIAL